MKLSARSSGAWLAAAVMAVPLANTSVLPRFTFETRLLILAEVAQPMVVRLWRLQMESRFGDAVL
jgi:hypothetical protein